jgi:hypothetical protein
VTKRLIPAMVTTCGKLAAPFSPPVLSAMRPPHPVWATLFAMEDCHSPTWSEWEKSCKGFLPVPFW